MKRIAYLALLSIPACSDPVPPTPQGAWSVEFLGLTTECPISTHTAELGQVTSATKDEIITDGSDGATIDCTVSGTSTFSVDASGTKDDVTLHLVIDSISSDATIDNPAAGSVSYASITTARNPYSSNACIFYFEEDSGEGVATGRIWVAFQCPEVNYETATCEISQGYAIFENCATE